MFSKLSLLAAVLTLLLPAVAGAGELVKKTYINADGEKVTGYVYQSGGSGRGATTHRSRSTSSLDNRYPAFRSSGYVYGRGAGTFSTRSYGSNHGCRTVRSGAQTTRTNITYNVGRPIVVGRPRAVVRTYTRR